MYAIQSQHLLSDLIGRTYASRPVRPKGDTGGAAKVLISPDAAAKLGKDRATALRKSFTVGIGAVAIVLTAACHQFDSKASAAAAYVPEPVTQANTDVHDGSWISQAHALAAKHGADGTVLDLSY